MELTEAQASELRSAILTCLDGCVDEDKVYPEAIAENILNHAVRILLVEQREEYDA